MSSGKVAYSISEDEYIKYMNKLYLDQQAVNNLLFDEPWLSDNITIKALLCEHYSTCYYFDQLLEGLEDAFAAKDGMFYLDDKQALRITFLLLTLAQTKEELLKNTVSLSFH